MTTLDELFSDEEGREELQEAVADALALTGQELKTLDAAKLRNLFEALPEPVRSVANQWGLSDTVFVNNTRLYLKNHPARYRQILGLGSPQSAT
jgi:gamma-glutamyl phosphate reductase